MSRSNLGTATCYHAPEMAPHTGWEKLGSIRLGSNCSHPSCSSVDHIPTCLLNLLLGPHICGPQHILFQNHDFCGASLDMSASSSLLIQPKKIIRLKKGNHPRGFSLSLSPHIHTKRKYGQIRDSFTSWRNFSFFLFKWLEWPSSWATSHVLSNRLPHSWGQFIQGTSIIWEPVAISLKHCNLHNGRRCFLDWGL